MSRARLDKKKSLTDGKQLLEEDNVQPAPIYGRAWFIYMNSILVCALYKTVKWLGIYIIHKQDPLW